MTGCTIARTETVWGEGDFLGRVEFKVGTFQKIKM